MKRFISALLASAALMAITTAPSFADQKMTNMKLNSMKVVHMCPKHKAWVNGYTTKSGKKVAGYCRKV